MNTIEEQYRQIRKNYTKVLDIVDLMNDSTKWEIWSSNDKNVKVTLYFDIPLVIEPYTQPIDEVPIFNVY